jgi:hypothetical protein
MRLSAHLTLIAGVVIAASLLSGCTDAPSSRASDARRPVPLETRPVARATTPSAPITPTTQPWERPPYFTDDRVRELYWKAGTGSCVYYRPPYKSQPVYYDRFPHLELESCSSKRATHKVVKRHKKYAQCGPGQGRYTVNHPASSLVAVFTLCLRPL